MARPARSASWPRPVRLPPIISGHNNYYLWGPGTCTGQVLIGVGFSPADFQGTYADVVVAATQRCPYCVSFEQDLPIVVASNPTTPIDLAQLWPRSSTMTKSSLGALILLGGLSLRAFCA